VPVPVPVPAVSRPVGCQQVSALGVGHRRVVIEHIRQPRQAGVLDEIAPHDGVGAWRVGRP